MSMMSPMCLEEVGALLLGPSSLMADPFGPLLDEDEESVLSEGMSSPLSSSYSESSSSLSPLSPSLCASVGCKSELSSLSWLPASEPEQSKDPFSGMDWMTEKIDLGDFDLDSLIGSCDSDEPPSSPEDLLACLEADMDLDLHSMAFSSSDLDLPLPPIPLDLGLSEPAADPEKTLESVEIKSEPPSPVPSPDSGLSSPNTLDLGSEIDVSELVKSSTVLQSPGIMLNLSPSHIVVVLTPKEEKRVDSLCDNGDSSDSDSGVSVSGSPAHCPDPVSSPKPVGSSRTKPYSRSEAAPAVSSRVKTGAPKVVEKKLKKMEQNKTAATRYRQKKRAEQEVLTAECTDLERRNQDLREKADSISREIQYLKNLMEEVRSAKHRKAKVSSA